MVTATSSKASTAKPDKPAKRAPIRTYDAALRYLFSHTDYEQMLRVRYNRDTFSLSRMESLLKKLGDPHKSLRCAHVAGTKGKGSTCTMLASMLQASSHRHPRAHPHQRRHDHPGRAHALHQPPGADRR
jgi:UDP-N-acetylmuramyl pentapeptide synthase